MTFVITQGCCNDASCIAVGANRFLSDVDMFTDHSRAGRLDHDAMVTKVLPFAEINDGLAAMADPDAVRVVVDLARPSA